MSAPKARPMCLRVHVVSLRTSHETFALLSRGGRTHWGCFSTVQATGRIVETFACGVKGHGRWRKTFATRAGITCRRCRLVERAFLAESC